MSLSITYLSFQIKDHFRFMRPMLEYLEYSVTQNTKNSTISQDLLKRI